MTPELRARLDDLPTTPAPGKPLSPAQTLVLVLLAEGLTNEQIAARTGFTYHSVHGQVFAILRKLDVPTRAAAVHRAWQQRILT